MSDPPVQLAPGLDVRRIAQVYALAGRVHIAPILEHECALRAYRCLAQETPWQLHFNRGEQAYDAPLEQVRSLPPPELERLLDSMHRSAAAGFQYVFNNFPMSDAYALGERRELYVMRVLEFLNSPAFLNFARAITGVSAIAVVDAQATLYERGHFLTRHDDLAAGKNRIAAYVLNLTPQWRADWGGVLNFIDRDGHIAEGYTPVFNALNLFKVPQPHAVSYVTPFAQGGRYSITGWLRSG